MLTVWMILPVIASLVSLAALLLTPLYVTTDPAVPTRLALIASISSRFGSFDGVPASWPIFPAFYVTAESCRWILPSGPAPSPLELGTVLEPTISPPPTDVTYPKFLRIIWGF